MRVLLDANLPRGFPFQQNLRGRAIAIVVLQADSNRLQDLEPLVPALLAALPGAKSGDVVQVGVRS